ncbi:MAG: double-strand break repair helicase AddA [Rubrimonas sp.]
MTLDATFDLIRLATESQRRAANPATSVWTSANAGSGKTRVLTDRVARLLLAGARPERILCLTYTKAAAAEMTARLSRMLGGWALMEDDPLRAQLTALDGGATALAPERLADARRLFAQALETPGGLKIQTIHAFCDAVLRRFPLEAGVSPSFEVLDDAARDELAARARDRLAEAAAAGEEAAFDRVAAHVGDEGMDALCAAILSERALFQRPASDEDLCAALGLTPADLDDRPRDRVMPEFDAAELKRAAAIMAGGGRTDQDLAQRLTLALTATDPDMRDAALDAALLIASGAPRKLDRLPTKAVDAAHPWIRPLLTDLQASWIGARARADSIAAAARAIALNRFATAFLAAFEDEKRLRAALDFDDLVERAGWLLTEGEMGAWALYKLDGGVDHVLVDEAQDTAPGQWRVIRALTAELGAGEGARDQTRTLFVVGDEKQSIYSFQGADPRLFGETREWARERIPGLIVNDLLASFRSAPAILRTVDATFSGAGAAGLSSDGDAPRHLAARTLIGRVDLWPLIPKAENAPDPPWDAPVDAPAPLDPRIVLARMLAAELKRWFDEGEPLPGGDRPVRPGDVMVLVRRRDLLARELIRALKVAGVPVAGADRMDIGAQLAVKDLLALARFALTPGDDLTLASLLRSPLCGMDGPTLEALAIGRKGPLWHALRTAPDHAALAERLARAAARADYLRPYEFFERALIDDGGREALLARLGPESEDAIDELLAQALNHEAGSTPTLEGFLDWMGRGKVIIKREMDAAASAVRVMTVHGAKGLEAPVVILPDTGPRRGGRPGPIVSAPAPAGRGANAATGRVPLWRAPAKAAPPIQTEAEADRVRAEREESRRLLYVAMTRAERWLLVCGAGDAERSEGAEGERETWHGLVSDAMTRLPAFPVDGPADLPGRVTRVADTGVAAFDAVTEPPRPAPVAAEWMRRPPPPAPPTPARMAASDLGTHLPKAGLGRGREAALDRGAAIHVLLEHLPGAPPSTRPALAARLLARFAATADAADRAAMLAEAEAAMALPEAAALFGPDALAEVALSVALPGGGRVSGRIDRLWIGPDQVFAADFKTDAVPPGSVSEAPAAYLAQVAAYAAALRILHPGREVRMALLWTAATRLDVVPEPMLAAVCFASGGHLDPRTGGS